MKIGILTFHRAHNYGAMLQAYALHKLLAKRGHNVEFISYRQPKIENAYKTFLWSYDATKGIVENIKNLLSALLTFPRRLKRSNAFVSFAKKYLPESKPYSKKELLSVSLPYDIVFFGSDQIWTTRFLGTFDDIFWGEISLTKGKKVAYAPSMELDSLTEDEKEYIRKHIRNFDAISAREMNMSVLLQSIIGSNVPNVLDPTLLCRESDYASFVLSSNKIPIEPYVLVYQVGHYRQVDEIAKKVSEQLNCKIIEIGSEVLLHSASSYKDYYGPEDFVALIANAKFVVSCSFHGTAFSVIFHKPFYSVLISGIDSRVKSFLSKVELMQCAIREAKEVNTKSLLDLDYSKVDKSLNSMREVSINYILKILN